MIEVQTIVGAAHWASYLVNGDASGLTDEDVVACEKWLAVECKPDGWHVVSVEDEEPWFSWSYDLYTHTGFAGGSLLGYICHRRVQS